MQVFHYSCVPGINAHPLCVCTLYLFDCYNYTLTFAVPGCMFVTERTLVRPDKAATRVLFMHFWNVFWMYSEEIHYIHNNGSESLLHALSSFSARFSLAHTQAIFFSSLPILLVYTFYIILWASPFLYLYIFCMWQGRCDKHYFAVLLDILVWLLAGLLYFIQTKIKSRQGRTPFDLFYCIESYIMQSCFCTHARHDHLLWQFFFLVCIRLT